jgi:hypothetical protein
MPTPADARHPALENAELLLKLGTAAVGLLFVLGILVSNAQLMELGISDFASLQTRNVMIGFLFVIYVLIFLLGISPILILPLLIKQIVAGSATFPQKGLKIFAFTLGCGLAGFASAGVAGLLIGFFYPWGRPYRAGYDFSAHTWFLTNDMVAVWRQFIEAYWHYKASVAAVAWVMACFFG